MNKGTSQKYVKQFSAKILRAKNLYQSSAFQREQLKKKSEELTGQYERILLEREGAESEEEALREHYLSLRRAKQQEDEICEAELEEINNLKTLKRKLKRENDIAEAILAKNTLILKQLVAQREGLQKMNFSTKESISSMDQQKETLRTLCDKTHRSIENSSSRLMKLKDEIENVKGLIVTLSSQPKQ